jgi:hypothetical protein
MRKIIGALTKGVRILALLLLCMTLALCSLISCDEGDKGQQNEPPKQETDGGGDDGGNENGGSTEGGGSSDGEGEDEGSAGEDEDGFPQVELPFMPF